MNTKRTQYRQIDFLRLFRLCRARGIVKRKRKMPAQFDRASHENSCCSKLFKSFLTDTFEDAEIKVDNRAGTYSIITPEGAAERLRFIRDNLGAIRTNHPEMFRRYSELTTPDNDFVRSLTSCNFAYFLITVAAQRNSRYGNLIENLPENARANQVSRPKEEYYRCALACLEFKELWNNHIGVLCSFVDSQREEVRVAEEQRRREAVREEARQRQAAEERRRQEQEEAAAAATRAEAERQAVRQQAERTEEARRRRSQNLFNNALNRRRGVENEQR